MKEVIKQKMKDIKINGYSLDGALLVDDPEGKKTIVDSSGHTRSVRSFSQPGRLKSYIRRHPEGIILAGVGNFFFLEPVPVSSAMIRFDETGSADIQVKDGAEMIQRQLAAMDAIHAAASKAAGMTHGGSAC